MLSFKCRDVGFDCNYVINEDDDAEIIKKVIEHGKKDHNLNQEDFNPSLIETIRGKIETIN